MNELDLINKTGIFLVVSQFTLVIIVFLFYLNGGYEFDEMTTTIGLMFPMLSIYTIGIIKFLTHNRNKKLKKQPKVNKEFAFIGWFFPILFILTLGAIIIIKGLKGFGDFEEFKTSLSIIESTFGGFTGYIISTLLESQTIK